MSVLPHACARGVSPARGHSRVAHQGQDALRDGRDGAVLEVCLQLLPHIADQVLPGPEGVVSQEVPDRVLFSLLSDFYLTPGAEAGEELSESIDEVSFV